LSQARGPNAGARAAFWNFSVKGGLIEAAEIRGIASGPQTLDD
jgi:hypothetical protein